VKETDMDANDVKRTKIRSRVLVATVLVVLAVTFLRVPLASVFSLGVLLICPLLMVGMHGGHGGGHHGEHPASADHRGADRSFHAHDDRPSSLAGPGRDGTFAPGDGGRTEIANGPRREVWRP
jgi:hypothetical protein